MELTLAEAATILGKTERQIRYMIRHDQLAATKREGRWRIASEHLPLTEGQRATLAERTGRARNAFEKAVAPAEKVTSGEAARRRYSITDLDAFKIGAELLAEARTAGVPQAAELLHHCLEDLGRGCHEFHAGHKRRRFAEARDTAARAAVRLLTDPSANEATERLAERIETELIPKIAGLVAAQEKRSRRGRLHRFGRAFDNDFEP